MTFNIENQDFLIYADTLKKKSMDLIILDPPYNIGAANWDKIENYFIWMVKVLQKCETLLKDNASLYLWGTTKNNDFIKLKLWLDTKFKTHLFKNWIVWVHEVKAHRAPKNNYLLKHEDLLFYSGIDNTFNMVRDEPPEFQLKMHKGRYDDKYFIERSKLPPSQQKIFKKGLQLGSPAKSWWKGKSNQSAGKKIKKFMGYKSQWVCERIIKVSSNVGDNILIPFAGTGSECISGFELERNIYGSEIDKERYDIIMDRFQDIKKENCTVLPFE